MGNRSHRSRKRHVCHKILIPYYVVHKIIMAISTVDYALARVSRIVYVGRRVSSNITYKIIENVCACA